MDARRLLGFKDTHMAHLPPDPHSDSDTGEDIGVGPDRGSPPSTPRWVKVSGIIGIVLVLLVATMMCTGIGGEHGPGRHLPTGGAGGHTPPLVHGVHQS